MYENERWNNFFRSTLSTYRMCSLLVNPTMERTKSPVEVLDMQSEMWKRFNQKLNQIYKQLNLTKF